jgi:hypothetical protein
MKGEFDLYGEAEKLYSGLSSIIDGKTSGESYFQEKIRYISNFKKATCGRARRAWVVFSLQIHKGLQNEKRA